MIASAATILEQDPDGGEKSGDENEHGTYGFNTLNCRPCRSASSLQKTLNLRAHQGQIQFWLRTGADATEGGRHNFPVKSQNDRSPDEPGFDENRVAYPGTCYRRANPVRGERQSDGLFSLANNLMVSEILAGRKGVRTHRQGCAAQALTAYGGAPAVSLSLATGKASIAGGDPDSSQSFDRTSSTQASDNELS